MENIIVWYIIGFVVCFALLFVFIAKYRAILEQEEDSLEAEEDLELETVSKEGIYTPRTVLLEEPKNSAALELADLKEQFRALHYQLTEFKVVSNTAQTDLAKQVARLEQRLGTFEQEYVNKLQPTLLRVIEELEHVKGEETAAVQSSKGKKNV